MNEIALLKPKLIRLKLSGMLENLDERLEQATKDKWAYTHFLHLLFEDEITRRDQKQMGLRLTRSGLSPEKTLETFDFSFNSKIHEPTIRELATCSFVGKKENIFFVGPSGVGKSHLAQALGHEACRRGYDTIFRRTFGLFDWIQAGKGDGTYSRRMQQIIRTPLLVLDDFGLKTLSEEAQSDLYEVICERYEKVPTILTSNRDFNEWPGVFSNPLMGSAAMDRLVHRGVKIVIEGNSYRMNNFARRSKELTSEAPD